MRADMGAGSLDLSSVADPGALLDPPSLSFGYLTQGNLVCCFLSLFSVESVTADK